MICHNLGHSKLLTSSAGESVSCVSSAVAGAQIQGQPLLNCCCCLEPTIIAFTLVFWIHVLFILYSPEETLALCLLILDFFPGLIKGPTFIEFWNFFYGLWIFQVYSMPMFILGTKFPRPYIYSRPYVYSFWQIFQALCLFPALPLFQTLE